MLEHAQVLVDGVEYLVRFRQVDVEDLGVECARVGGKQTLRFLRQRRGRRGTRLDDEVDARGKCRLRAAAVDFAYRRFHLRGELGVADEVGVVAQAHEL